MASIQLYVDQFFWLDKLRISGVIFSRMKGNVLAKRSIFNSYRRKIRFKGNCNYILLSKLPWPRESKGTVRSSSQAATCLPDTVDASYCPLQGSCEYQFCSLWFNPIGNGTSVADALSTRPLIGITITINFS